MVMSRKPTTVTSSRHHERRRQPLIEEEKNEHPAALDSHIHSRFSHARATLARHGRFRVVARQLPPAPSRWDYVGFLLFLALNMAVPVVVPMILAR